MSLEIFLWIIIGGIIVATLGAGSVYYLNEIPTKKQLSRDAVFVFYYAGHAVEINGENYFLPVDAEINNEADVKENSLRLRDLIEVVNSTESNFNLYFVDASRDNPFARTAIGR